tara:strand:+ start:208 stop:708 length:501 start_codon:yes stop_codon:yes gene_type:complete
MAFTAGDILCCASDACVLLDEAAGSGAEDWDLIPHVTLIGVTETANTPKLVTSSSGGAELSSCGTVTRSGNLALACHSGSGPGMLCINSLHRIRWSDNCDNIWLNGIPVANPVEGFYFEAVIRITSVPVIYDIAGNQAIVVNYGFDIQRWVHHPTVDELCQTAQDA